MKKNFDFDGLFIYDLANNHQGNVEHGLKIITEIAKVSNAAGVKGAIKFQFRELNTLIHPAHVKNSENKHIVRFLETKLSIKDYELLLKAARDNNLIAICTPFDESSVEAIVKLDIELIKVASCCANDWPLLEKISETGKPVICSTGGLSVKSIDNIVSFFQHRGVNFALMHCVAVYPTPEDELQLDKIEMLCNRYPQVTVGFSTHEIPDNFSAIGIAYAKGARLFERHVGVQTDKFKLNAYSSTPEQIAKWLQAYKATVGMCAFTDGQITNTKEGESLRSLMRGVYAKGPIKQGDKIGKTEVYFAMPLLVNQFKSGDFQEGLTADKDYKKDEALSGNIYRSCFSKKEIIYQAIHEIKGMLNMARIAVGNDFSVELSHHYGIEKFCDIGATIIDCVNRAYCKKLIVQLPGQSHPYHYHKKKEETFQVLYGDLEVEVEGRKKSLYPGDTILVQQGVWHKFLTVKGAIFEEISTTHYNDDSFYEDKEINKLPREARKTQLINWGRYQFE